VPTFIHYLPIATTLLAALFAPVVFRRWRERRPAPHLWWWSMGITLFGLGTLTESATTLLGWSEPVFRAWYISGALLGGWPLAQGTVYLMFSRRTAHCMAAAVGAVVIVGATVVLLSPIDYALVEAHRLSGGVLQWRGARLFSPFVNTYAAIFLVGGAILSAWRYRLDPGAGRRVIGNCFIAVGALLPGIGGAATRMGHTEVLYVTELLGLVLIWTGYLFNVRPRHDPAGSPAAIASA
jgi:hypothetical protein